MSVDEHAVSTKIDLSEGFLSSGAVESDPDAPEARTTHEGTEVHE